MKPPDSFCVFISEYSVVRAVQRKIHVIITAFYYSNYVLKIS